CQAGGDPALDRCKAPAAPAACFAAFSTMTWSARVGLRGGSGDCARPCSREFMGSLAAYPMLRKPLTWSHSFPVQPPCRGRRWPVGTADEQKQDGLQVQCNPKPDNSSRRPSSAGPFSSLADVLMFVHREQLNTLAISLGMATN